MNKRTEQTRWTPKRLLSLLMALIMTLSLLPTAVFANDETKTFYLNTFIPASEEPESVAEVASGAIGTNGTSYRLSVHIDPKPDYAPGQKVDVRATADLLLKGGDQVDESHPLKVTVGNTAVTSKPNSSPSDSTSQTATDNSRTIGLDGSISFTTSIEYSVIPSGSSEAITGSKTVSVKIKDLWTGYNVTYTNDNGETFTGLTSTTAKTVAKDASSGEYEQVYTIPAGATASKNNCTFEGWRVSIAGLVSYNTQPGARLEGITGDVTLTALLPENQEITFNPVYSGVSGLPYTLKATSTGSTYKIPYTPQLANYTFNGWSVTRGTAKIDPNDSSKVVDISEPITLTPNWVPADGSTPAGSHKVTFDGVYTGVSNIPAVQVVKDGETTTAPTQTPLREGYVFKHWSATQNGEAYAFDSALTEDLTLYAVWEREKVYITWPTGLTGVSSTSPSPLPASVDKGSSISFQLKLDNGYEFRQGAVKVDGVPLGWTFDEATNTYHFTFKADTDAENKTIAVTAGNPTVKTFTISLPQGDGYAATFTDCKDAAGTAITAAEGMTSYTFSYGDKFKIKLESDADVAATLRVNGAVATTTNGKDTLTATTGEYTVEGNYLVSASAKRRVERAVIFTLLPEYSQYTQMFVDNGSKITAPTAPDIAGYNFGGKWYKDANCETEWDFNTDTVTSNTVLYGKLTAKTYTISYNENRPAGVTDAVAGMPTSNTTKTHGIAASLSDATPTLTGYTFKGWATSANGPVAYAAGGQYLVDSDITLYAVWQINTFTVTVSSGAGYSTVPSGTYTVEYGKPFTVTINVDRQYAAVKPTVMDNGTPVEVTGNPNDIGAASYTYTINSVTNNHSIDITVTQNEVHQVLFYEALADKDGNNPQDKAAPFASQLVEHGYYASMPSAQENEGYKFDHWERFDPAANKWSSDLAETFAKPILAETKFRAVYKQIVPVITVDALSGDGWELTNWKIGDTAATLTNNRFEVPYGSTITFDLVVKNGYKYDNSVSVAANGYALAPYGDPEVSNDGTTTIHFRLTSVTKDTNISVSGVVRKTITINYFANAGDDVASVPGPQTDVKYYINETGVENSNIINFTPIRTGYNFLGWCENPAPTGEKTYNNQKLVKFGENAVYQPGDTATFTKDTNLYAIWLAQDTELTLKITDVAYDTQQNNRVIQYEGESITLQATLNVNAKGTVVFYKGDKEGTNGTRIGSAAINGKTAELSVKVGDYKAGGVTEHYWAVFESETDEGYANSEKSNIMNVGVFSKALSWKITKGTSNVADNGNVLNVYEGDSATGTPITGNMVAGRTYTLEVKTASITGVETLDSKQPVLGKDYKIVWQYTEVGKNDWKTDGEASDKATYLVTGDKSGYQFRAQIVPLGPDNGSLFIKAGKFNENDVLLNDQYDTCLYTKSTNTTVRQSTATALTIDAPEESKDIKINGDTPFTAIGDHKAQFEGQAVTLTAKVTKDGGNDGVETGYVKFYRHVDGTNDTLLNTTLISVDANGIATLEVKVSAWDTAKTAIQNLDQFYAVYETNETYETSKSDSEAVYIKSAKLMTPIIESELEGTNGAKGTTYSKDLTGLLAGVQHTFKLRQDADQTAKDYSVVALDGRTVEAKNYDIEWQYKTGDNFVKANNESTQAAYTTTTTKVDDRYRVKLTGKGVFAGSEATSKDAVIGTKQDVTVTVKALDAIESTAATDVYQLNEITLTATVAAAKGADATMKPTSTVTFYYSVDGTNWTKIGEAKDLAEVAGVMTASIKTDQLPVKANDNTKQDVKITAVYSGDATFNASATVNETKKSITAAAGCTTTDDTVTVYSSVVFNCNDENKKQTTDGDKGIHISVSDGAFKANEKATLALSDIYTLDRELTDEALRNTIAKLNPTTDYTVQWQKLNGATAITSGDYGAAKNWTNIDGKTGTTLVLGKVEQNTAYRAVITVKNQPITKGSFDKLDQGVIDTADANDGRQVYYSNVLMPTDTNMTVSVALNTSKIGAENTEGETVTANVFLSGVVGVVPNANVTVKVTNDSAKGNNTAYEKTFTSMNTVNGWNAFSWNTAESDDKGVPTAPGFYTLTVSATTNTGYAAKEITRSLIVRESSYTIVPENTTVTYNGRTQGLTVALNGFGFNGTGINEAANKSWTVKYYDKDNNLVEPTQAGTYRAVITLPASAYWTEQTKTVDFTIEKRSVSIADAIAQAKVYDGTTDVNIVEVMLNDAETEQGTTGWLKSGENTGIINGDSIYAVATAASLNSANAGNNSFKISTIELRGDDANNYVWNEAPYTEDIYVSRSQVYGVSSTDVTLKAGEKLPADAVYMIDQAGNKITTYDVLYYLHTDTEIKKVDNTNEKGLYTVIVRPKQDNYKSGVTLKVTVGDTTSYTPAVAPKPSTLLYLSDTATKYNPAGNAPVTAKNAQGNAVKVEYQTGTTWSETVPSNAGRYLVKATDTNTGDVAYGIYTITKAHPSIDFNAATGLTYNSKPQNGYTGTPNVGTESAESYFTYAGDVAIGYNVQKEGNVDEQAPVDAGTYTVTLHVNETENYTAHEISKSFTIAKKALTIKADSWQTTQYDAFPDMTAKYQGLAAEDTDATPDTSLRDVQIAPEFLYNPTGGKSNYSNDSLDQVGGVAIQPIDALSKNYAITYENGQYTKQRTETNVDLAIHGLPQSSTGKNTVYYGDEIQLYPYGYYTTHANGSGIFEWSVTTATGFKGMVKIGKETGLLNVNGVGEFTVTLKRGVGEQQIKTELTVTALKKEVKVHVTDQDKVYSGSAQTYSGEVKAYDELYATVNAATTTPANNTRTDIGTQITTSRIATGSEKYQSLVYGGQFTINDKEATVAPVADAHIYGTTRTIPSPAYTSTDSNAISNVLTASRTDAYNRLDVHDGYEILVAGTENMNYNVKYTTDHNDTAKNADDSAVTTYGGETFTSKTTKELNDATVYGETPNVLDWTLVNVIGTTRGTTSETKDYADNLADFNLPDTFVWQDKDDCTGNKVTYKAANRTTDVSDSNNIKYNQAALTGPRTSEDPDTDENYTLKFNTVENSGAANYKLTNDKTGNSATTTNALTANSKGFIPATGESNDVSGENFVEGSANIAQRPIKLEKAVDDVQLYWKLSQKQLYTALVNVLKAEENSVGRGLAKGHTIEDLDLSFTIKVGSTTYNVAKDGTDAINFAATGNATVTATVGDTNYKLENGPFTFDIVLKNIQIEATYTTKTFTGFTVLIKVHNENGTITPLNDAKGLSYKIFKKTGDTIDKTTAYASGTLTYQNRTAYDDKGGLCGVFTATYPQLPLLNSGETYFIQMYEYGVELKTNS